MEQSLNELGQPIGFLVPGWQPPARPPLAVMEGLYCRLKPLDPQRHAEELFEANASDDGRSWTYLPYGPFATLADYRQWMNAACLGDDPLLFAIVDQANGLAAGVAAYLNIAPQHGSIEVGHLHFTPRLQRKPAATEAMYLMMERAFELGYRRYEWKANALNAPSRSAAQRLGLSFEGIFRQASVVKRRNRDTAWYSAIDSEWPKLARGVPNLAGTRQLRLGRQTAHTAF